MTLRTTLAALAFAASCAAAPPPPPMPATPPAPPLQAAGDAEALYKKMEATLAGAKKLSVDFESAAEGSTVKGNFTIDEGNKLQMKVDGVMGAKKYTLEMSCDGAKMTLTRVESPAPPVALGPQPELPAPANLTANVAASLARGGAWLAQEAADGEYRRVADPWFEERQTAFEQKRAANPVPPVAPRDMTSLHALGPFRSGKAGEVSYDLVPKGDGFTVMATLTVWIDAKTSLPAKREGQFFQVIDGKPSGPALSKWTETYKFK